MKTNEKNSRFLINWTLINAILLPLGIFIGYFSDLVIHRQITTNEVGSHLIQTVDSLLFLLIMGIIISISQWILLRRYLNISIGWIFACIAGIIIGELVVAVVLWGMNINQFDLGWLQKGSVGIDAFIYLFTGAVVGIFQYPLIKRNFHRAGMWIIASSVGWCLIPLTMYVFGGIAYGAITGATFMWILKERK